MKRITALLMAAVVTFSLCTVITPVNPDNDGSGYENEIAPCDESDLGGTDYF